MTAGYFWNNNPSTLPLKNESPPNFVEGRDYFLYAKPGYTSYTYPHPLRVLKKTLNFPTARCEYPSAKTKWSLPQTGSTPGPMSPLCLPGTTALYGVLGAAPGTASTASTHFRLPSDFLPTQPMDVVVEYTGNAGSPTATNIVTQVAIACVADGQSIFPSSYTESVANASGPAAAGAKGLVAFPSFNNVANCAAGNHVVLKLDRLSSGDTYTGEAQYLNVELTYRRTGP